MNADRFLLLLATATALRGLGAGTLAGLLLMLPLRGRIGLVPYAQANRALYKGRGVRAYAAVTILGALLTVVVSQPPRFSTPRVSARLSRSQASWTASSASLKEPSIR